MRRKDPEAEHFLKATLVISFVSVIEVCVYVSKEFSMWNNIQPSWLRLGSWNYGIGSKLDEAEGSGSGATFLKATLVISFVSVNGLYVHVQKEFSMRNNIQHSQLWLGSWNRLDVRWGEKIRNRNTFFKATLVISFVSVIEVCVHVPKVFSMWNNIQPSRLRLGS